MNKFELLLVSLSCSATLIALGVFIIRLLNRNRLSYTTLYYSWLPVLFRALLPVSFDAAIINQIARKYYAAANYFVKPMEFGTEGRKIIIGSNVHAPALQELNRFTFWLVLWMVVAVALLIKKITSYHAFSKYIRSGWRPVESLEVLDILGSICEEMNIHRPIELCVNPLVSSPLLLGIFKPVIVLPAIPDHPDLLHYTITHELIHYKRQDVIYIWLMQIALCVHWFNPLFYLIHQQTAKDRELSCDEQVIAGLSVSEKITYGKTLLETFAQNGSYQERHVTSALLENKSLLKKRLEAIDSYHTSSGTHFPLIAILLLLVSLCLVLGVYIPVNEI